MVGSIIGGFQQQTPASRAFEPNQAPNNPNNAQQISRAPQPATAPTTSVGSGVTEEINSKVALSRDIARDNPSQVSSSVNRGQNLDITA